MPQFIDFVEFVVQTHLFGWGHLSLRLPTASSIHHRHRQRQRDREREKEKERERQTWLFWAFCFARPKHMHACKLASKSDLGSIPHKPIYKKIHLIQQHSFQKPKSLTNPMNVHTSRHVLFAGVSYQGHEKSRFGMAQSSELFKVIQSYSKLLIVIFWCTLKNRDRHKGHSSTTRPEDPDPVW